ncbi:MAG TPA: hypothetical protein DD670_19455 [Planctomycetaceae bacterium]|nr:hypothetical protein [Planctomycetaceae bacterium]
MTRSARFCYLWVAMVAVSGLAAGCGSSLDSSVSGTVTLGGKPLELGNGTGTVSFYPENGGPAAQANIEPDGTYSIKTGGTKGIRSGAYFVTAVATGPSPPSPPGASPLPGPLLIPTRYGTPQTSNLHFPIAPGSNQIDIAITSE